MNIPIKEVDIMDGISIHQGIDHIKERIYIHLDVTTICNYKCSYCCNRDDVTYWQKPAITKNLMIFFDDLERVKNEHDIPIFLMFTGGEPTYAIKYFDLIERARELLTHPDDRLILESNGAKPLEFFMQYPVCDKTNVYHMFSVHPEYLNKDNFYEFVSKVKSIINKGYKVKVNLMMMHSEKYYDFMEYAYKLMKECDFDVHPHFIYFKDEHNPIKYPKKFWDRFGDLMNTAKPIFDQDGKHYTDYEIFKDKRNVFTGWKCYHNNITVSLNGTIANQCFTIDKIEDVFELMKGKICPHKSCNCDGLLKIRKEKLHE